MHEPRLFGSVLSCVLLFLGCERPLYGPGAAFKYQDDVGTAKLTVVSVAPWEQIESLVPDFALTGREALQQVAATGRAESEAYLTARRLLLEIGLGGRPSGKAGDQADAKAAQSAVEQPDAKPAPPTKRIEPQSMKEMQGVLKELLDALDAKTAISASSRHRLALALYQVGEGRPTVARAACVRRQGAVQW